MRSSGAVSPGLDRYSAPLGRRPRRDRSRPRPTTKLGEPNSDPMPGRWPPRSQGEACSGPATETAGRHRLACFPAGSHDEPVAALLVGRSRPRIAPLIPRESRRFVRGLVRSRSKRRAARHGKWPRVLPGRGDASVRAGWDDVLDLVPGRRGPGDHGAGPKCPFAPQARLNVGFPVWLAEGHALTWPHLKRMIMPMYPPHPSHPPGHPHPFDPGHCSWDAMREQERRQAEAFAYLSWRDAQHARSSPYIPSPRSAASPGPTARVAAPIAMPAVAAPAERERPPVRPTPAEPVAPQLFMGLLIPALLLLSNYYYIMVNTGATTLPDAGLLGVVLPLVWILTGFGVGSVICVGAILVNLFRLLRWFVS